MIALQASALALGQVLTSIAKLRKSLAVAIASRMVPRNGKFLWQTATGCVENFPREAALQILPETMRSHTAQKEDWAAKTMTEVAALIGPIIVKSTSYSAGATKALLTDSERVVRVVAIVMPTAKFWWRDRQGVDCLYMEFQYILADEDGELNKPKDGNKIEIALEPQLETAIREHLHTDLKAMAEAGAPLSPGFLRQLGRMDEAMLVETSGGCTISSRRSSRRRRQAGRRRSAGGRASPGSTSTRFSTSGREA